MSKIRITGYVSSDDFDEEYLDPKHETGLTSAGYDELMRTLIEDLDDVRISVEK